MNVYLLALLFSSALVSSLPQDHLGHGPQGDFNGGFPPNGPPVVNGFQNGQPNGPPNGFQNGQQNVPQQGVQNGFQDGPGQPMVPQNGPQGIVQNGVQGGPPGMPGSQCADPFPVNGLYKLQHINGQAYTLSFCGGGCVLKDGRLYDKAKYGVVAGVDGADVWYNAWNVNRTGNGLVRLSLTPMGNLNAERAVDDVPLFVSNTTYTEFRYTVHPEQGCAVTLQNEEGKYIKSSATVPQWDTLKPLEYRYAEMTGPAPSDNSHFFRVNHIASALNMTMAPKRSSAVTVKLSTATVLAAMVVIKLI